MMMMMMRCTLLLLLTNCVRVRWGSSTMLLLLLFVAVEPLAVASANTQINNHQNYNRIKLWCWWWHTALRIPSTTRAHTHAWLENRKKKSHTRNVLVEAPVCFSKTRHDNTLHMCLTHQWAEASREEKSETTRLLCEWTNIDWRFYSFNKFYSPFATAASSQRNAMSRYI